MTVRRDDYQIRELKRWALKRARRFEKKTGVRLCGEPGCCNHHFANNLCNKHRARVLRTGRINLKRESKQ